MYIALYSSFFTRKREREREKNNLEQSRNKVTGRREYRGCLKSVAVACSPLSRQLTLNNKSLFPSFDSSTLHSSLKTSAINSSMMVCNWLQIGKIYRPCNYASGTTIRLCLISITHNCYCQVP